MRHTATIDGGRANTVALHVKRVTGALEATIDDGRANTVALHVIRVTGAIQQQ